MNEQSSSKRLDIVLALLLFVLVAVVFQQSATTLTEQGVASGDAMNNAAMFPKLLAVILGMLAAIQFIVSLRRPATAEGVKFSFPVRNSLFVVGLLAIYILALPWLGYHIMTPLLCLSILLLLGLRLIPAILFGAGMSLVVAVFFETLLNVVLPVGIFGLTFPF